MVTHPDVVVIGAGAVGLSTAFFLATQGARVEVIEAGHTPGWGASGANAGWLVPTMCEPVPSLAALRAARKWIGRRDSPLKIGVSASPGYLTFLGRMLLATRPSAHELGLRSAAALALHALEAFDELESLGVEFERHRGPGVLQVFLQEDSLAHHMADLEAVSRLGLPVPKLVEHREMRHLEPLVGEDVVGGILCPEEQFLDPSSFMEGLTICCRDIGVHLREGVTATSVDETGGILRVTTSSGTASTGSVVLAAGVGSRRLAASLGARLPVRAGKGYGFDYTPAPVSLGHALYLSDHKVAVTPLDRGTRFAGTMEFGSETDTVDQLRAEGVMNSVPRYLPSWPKKKMSPAWVGLRPMTPDGLPVIGPTRDGSRVFVATGHAMLGITLGPVTGRLLSREILTGQRSPLLEPFDLHRFSRHRRA